MKTQWMKLTLLFLLFTIYQVNSLSNVYQIILHEDSEYTKVCTLDNQNVVAFSTIKGMQKSKLSLLDKRGNIILADSPIDEGFSPSAQLVEPHSADESDYFLFYHNKQKLTPKSPKEFAMLFKEGKTPKKTERKESLYQQKSVVALKSGKVLVAGINPTNLVANPPSGYYQTTIETSIYDPATDRWGNGITFNDAFSHLISCIELKQNEFYMSFTILKYYSFDCFQ